MKRTNSLALVGLAAAMAAVAGSCGDSSLDPGSPPADAGTPPLSCGADCRTDLAAARAALETADYQKAFDLYRCADTPEAAFGAGLTRIFLALEGNNADAVMADFGQPPLFARDLIGPNSILSRSAARWQGQGSLQLSGALSLALSFDRAQQPIPTDPNSSGYGTFSATDSSEADADLSIGFGYPGGTVGPLVTGAALGVSFDCASSYPSRTMDQRLGWVDLSFTQQGVQYWCQIPYSLTTGPCQADGGSIVVDSAATSPGQQASYTLQNLLLACQPESATPTLAPTIYQVRATGTVSALAVSQDLDTTGLHPMFANGFSWSAGIPADRKVTDLVRHVGAVAEELEEAGCFLNRAAQGSGTIFTVPGVLYGGKDLPVSQGDTQVLASFSYLAAATGHLVSAYEIDMPLNQLICDSSTSSVACPSDQQLVSSFNAAFASAFHGGEFAVAQSLAAIGLPLLDAGLGHLDASSLLVKNGVSTEGIGLFRDVVQAAVQSLANGSVALPHVSPTVTLDLKAFFANPRNPRDVGAPVLLYQQQCDAYGCYSSTEVNSTFLNQYFAGSIGADWSSSSYQWSNDQAVTDALNEFGRSLERYFLSGG
jgi:hypothetical protein